MQQSQQSQQQQCQTIQELNQEDLAAVLPEQEHEDAPFDGFEDSESGRLVSKAIERMSLGADSDTSENTDQNPVPVYSSTLLQQFVEKTALLSEPRKRRSKLNKKLNDNEYPCVSNVSPDSGIQSVDNSPLHLAISPVSPPASTQSPIQTVTTKPVVNVDRVLYPPKRKPGRPAKTVSAQPRGPGRPRLKPEIVEKIEKIVKVEKKQTAISTAKNTKEDISTKKRGKTKSFPCKSVASRENKEDTSANKGVKGKMSHQKKRCGSSSQEKRNKKPGINSPIRVKCLSRSTADKLLPQYDGRTCRKVRQDRSCVSKKNTLLTRQKQTFCEQVSNDQKVLNTNKKSLKENRNIASTLCRKQNVAKKVVSLAVTRRVLKENKCNKKTAANFETNGVGVQTLISLPVGDILKAENMEHVSNKCEKIMQPIHNHCHKQHQHKHRRRSLVPPKQPIRADPYIVQALEKLIDEFSRSCSLGRNNTSTNHSELPQIFRMKKLTKKRKGDINSSEDQKLKRRLKKEKMLSNMDSKSSTNTSTNSNPNEQRLPLKKRHYHVSSPHSSQSSNASCMDVNTNESNSTESHIEEAIEATITRYGGSSTSSVHDDTVPVTPKKRHRDAENAASEKQGSSICDVSDDKSITQSEIQPRRKKKIVKDLRVTVTKLSSESHSALDKTDKTEKSSSDKNSKAPVEKSSKSEKIAGEKSTKADKMQLVANEKLDIVHTEKNIKVDSESYETFYETITENKLNQTNNSISSNTINNTTGMTLTKKKMRRRKAINRTGFPTLKKKKKKITNDSSRINQSDVLGNSDEVYKDQAIVEDVEDNKISLIGNEIQDALSENNNSRGNVRNDVKNFDSNVVQETSSRSGSDVTESCSGQLRVRKDLVESDSSILSDKIYPVKYEKIQECRTYDENASLEESLERYNQNQRIAELNEENLKKLERANSQVANIKMELSGCFNNNHKRRRGSASPSNLGSRSTKRLRSAGYDTEIEALPSSDITSEDQETRKSTGAIHNRKKQSRWNKRYLQSNICTDGNKAFESRKIASVDGNSSKSKIICENTEQSIAGVPASYQCGKLLRQRKMQFQLPYDLWWIHTQSRISGRDLVPSWNYK